MNVSRFSRLLGIACLLLLAADVPNAKQVNHIKADKLSLAAVQPFVGSWRGVGQPRRGSTKGAWIEKSDWAWKFSDIAAAITFASPEAKYFVSGSLRPTAEDRSFKLICSRAERGGEVSYSGALNEAGHLVLLADVSPGEVSRGDVADKDVPARITIRVVAEGNRLVMLYERKSGERYLRLAEVGYTRQGSRFGKGTSFVECVVTGGHGTIPVNHNGKVYYVCCSGCRDAFNDDPAGVLADYRERKAAEREKEATPSR